jgi:predicted transcriptional regulator
MFMENNSIGLTAQIVSAHVASNNVSSDQLPTLIREVYGALASVDTAPTEAIPSEPVVTAKKSVFADHIVCMDCGKSLKMLKRHLSADHNMTPAQYRSKWGLPASYPMVSSEYASQRSQLANG